MSIDTIDDLHAAEDFIGQLQTELAKWRPVVADIPEWCRPSCEDHDLDDPEEIRDCGCPCHDREVDQ